MFLEDLGIGNTPKITVTLLRQTRALDPIPHLKWSYHSLLGYIDHLKMSCGSGALTELLLSIFLLKNVTYANQLSYLFSYPLHQH